MGLAHWLATCRLSGRLHEPLVALLTPAPRGPPVGNPTAQRGVTHRPPTREGRVISFFLLLRVEEVEARQVVLVHELFVGGLGPSLGGTLRLQQLLHLQPLARRALLRQQLLRDRRTTHTTDSPTGASGASDRTQGGARAVGSNAAYAARVLRRARELKRRRAPRPIPRARVELGQVRLRGPLLALTGRPAGGLRVR
eukprot:614211-Prorocentrum_minimum.AAC.1